MSHYVIETNHLSKVYNTKKGGFRALDNLNLAVEKGEIFGYLGPNGAGKSTTIRMFTDLIRPTEGSVKILGYDAQKDSVELHRHIGFLPGELTLWKNEKSIDVIRYFARIHGDVDMDFVHDLAGRFQFDVNKRVRDYSTGNKRKLGIILAVMHKPDLLILDEPTSGLDPLMQQIFNNLMREFKDKGHTVFLSSHVLNEVQSICDRVGVLRGGVLKAIERVDRLTHADFRWVTIRVKNGIPAASNLTMIPGVTDVNQQDQNTVRLRLNGDFDPLIKAMNDRYVVDLRVQEPTLEEIFLAFYDDESQINGKVQSNSHKPQMA